MRRRTGTSEDRLQFAGDRRRSAPGTRQNGPTWARSARVSIRDPSCRERCGFQGLAATGSFRKGCPKCQVPNDTQDRREHGVSQPIGPPWDRSPSENETYSSEASFGAQPSVPSTLGETSRRNRSVTVSLGSPTEGLKRNSAEWP